MFHCIVFIFQMSITIGKHQISKNVLGVVLKDNITSQLPTTYICILLIVTVSLYHEELYTVKR